jgi:membrane protein
MSDLFLGIIILVLQFLVRDSLSVIPFDSAKTLINPFNYEENKVIFNVLILMFILMIFIINYLIKDFSDIYDMRNFILSRCSKKKMFLMIFKKGLLSILKILLMFSFVSLIFSKMTQILNLIDLIKIDLIMFLTLLSWFLIMTIMFFIIKSMKKMLYVVTVFLIIMQYIAFYIKYLGIIVISNQYTFENIIFFVIVKVIFIMCLVIIDYKLFDKWEVIGGCDDD